MKILNIIFLIFLIVVFLTGLYLYSFNKLFVKKCSRESFENNGIIEDSKDTFCPDLLINKGEFLLLYNTRKPEIKGINPVLFSNLDEYIQYLEKQRKNGINCPVLYLQRENDAQGKDVYRIRPSPFDQQGGNQPIRLTRSQMNHLDNNYKQTPKLLMSMNGETGPNNPILFVDASRENPPFNKGNYPGFDPTDQFTGIYTSIDAVHDSTKKTGQLSDNPMDDNWAGVLFTENSVQSGKYADNEVVKPIYTNTTNTVSYPAIIPHSAGLIAPNYTS